MTIQSVRTRDRRFPLPGGAGADAVHRDPVYAFACTELVADDGTVGTGFALTLGEGNDLVCRVVEGLAQDLPGRGIEELMADFGATCRAWADHPRWRWLGPHKGVVHLALASLANACFDLWAKSRGVPLWRLLLDCTPEALVAACDFSYCEDVLTPAAAIEILRGELRLRPSRESILRYGFPAYDTSAGWFSYDDARIERNVRQAMDAGFGAVKLKVGSPDPARDVRRAELVRSVAGDTLRILLDVNQQWRPDVAIERAQALSVVDPLWIEEPTHPDDIAAHCRIAREIAPVRVAAGEHLPNRIAFKNYLAAGACHYVQADAVRLGGVGEYLVVALMAKAHGLPTVPHVGDMGQLHQHLVLFDHVALGDPCPFLEVIPHLRDRFAFPARVESGRYATPPEPGASTAFRES